MKNSIVEDVIIPAIIVNELCGDKSSDTATTIAFQKLIDQFKKREG